MSEANLEGLKNYLNDKHPESGDIDKIFEQINEEDYDFGDLKDMAANDDEIDEMLNSIFDNDDAIVDKLKAIMVEYLTGGSNEKENEKQNEKENEKKTNKIITKTEVIQAYENGLKDKIGMTKFKKTIGKICMDYDDGGSKKDLSLMNTIFISKQLCPKNDNSILLLLVDKYTRNRIDNVTNITADKWCKDVFKGNKDYNKKIIDSLSSAISSYFSRSYKEISLQNSTYQIDDDINSFGNIMISVAEFVKNAANNYQTPMQFDIWIVPKNVESNDNDNDADNDSGDDLYNDDKEDEKKEETKDINILQLIKDGKIEKQCSISDFDDTKANREIQSNFNECLKINKIKNDKLRNRRFVMIFDRKCGKNEKNLYTFEPKKNNKIVKDYIPETLNALSKHFIDSKNNLIGANNGMNGYMFCVSFHIITKDLVKAYLYADSKISRFFMKDIGNIWSSLFFKKGKNELKKEIKNKLNEFDNKLLKDITLDQFLVE